MAFSIDSGGTIYNAHLGRIMRRIKGSERRMTAPSSRATAEQLRNEDEAARRKRDEISGPRAAFRGALARPPARGEFPN